MLDVFFNNTCETPVVLSKPKSDDAALGRPTLKAQLIELFNRLLFCVLCVHCIICNLKYLLPWISFGRLNSLNVCIIFLLFLHLECVVHSRLSTNVCCIGSSDSIVGCAIRTVLCHAYYKGTNEGHTL